MNKEQKQLIMRYFQAAAGYNVTPQEQAVASQQLAEAIALPIRKTLLSGDIFSNIFETMDFTDNPRVEFPLDLLVPGDEADHYAYTMPGHGLIPQRHVEGDYLMVPTYRVANAIDTNIRIIRDAQWDIIRRLVEILEAGFVKKMNDDAWQTILTAAYNRNIMVRDTNAAAGQLTPTLITLMSNYMRRNGGGNAATMDRSKLTDLYVSPEAHLDIRAWGLDLVPDGVRENIYYATGEDQDLIRIFGVNLHAFDEFGEGQAYQSYFDTNLGGASTLSGNSDVEIVVGLDLQRDDSFVHPVREELQIFEDNTLHRRGEFGLYGHAEIGFAVLDNRRTLLGSL